MRLMEWRPPEHFNPEDPVLYAEPWFNDVVAEHLGLRVVAPPDYFLVALPAEYVGRRVRLTSAVEARTISDRMFLKPPNRKVFPARIYSSGAELPELPEDDPVLVSDPVEWTAEFRYFVRDRRIRTWSPYLLNGSLARDGDEWIVDVESAAAATSLVERLLTDVRVELPPALVIDAGVIRGVGAAIVEANEASGAGIYGCDPAEVLDVLRAAVTNAEQL